jgi:hypothetical protein
MTTFTAKGTKLQHAVTGIIATVIEETPDSVTIKSAKITAVIPRSYVCADKWKVLTDAPC